MKETTEDKLIRVIKVLSDRIMPTTRSDDALKFTQAGLNAAHTIAVLRDSKRR